MTLNPNFIAAVQRLYPAASLARDVIVQDNSDGNGPFLAEWHLPGSPPTDAEIAAVMATPVVPQSVPMLAARRALRAAGLLSRVNEAIALQSGDVQDAWEYSLTVDRQSPTMNAIGALLNLSEAQKDALFVSAGALGGM